MPAESSDNDQLVQKLAVSSFPVKVLSVALVIALVAGTSSGYILAKTSKNSTTTLTTSSSSTTTATVKSAAQDTQTFRDFATGVIQKKNDSGTDYSEGTHLLIRDGQDPVALTSSVVDLNQYTGKKVTVYGETQKAVKEGWLMDVGKVIVQ